MTRYEAREYIGRLINKYNSNNLRERRIKPPAQLTTIARKERDRYSFDGSWFDDDTIYPDDD